MPRKTRKQPGTSGGAYPNRTDMTQPVQVPTGQAYGEAQASAEAQAAAPLPQQPPMEQVLAAAMGHNFQPVGINGETQRPYEPITHGLATGPGGGPEQLMPSSATSDTLMRLAQSTGNPALMAMAQRARQYGV
jgi:hypothetical protein